MTIQFSDLLHDKNLLAALRSAGYIEPTPIQVQALPAAIAPEAVESRLADAFRRIWTDATDSDRLNALLLVTTLDIGEIAVLRALGKYIIQAGAPYNYEQICAALNANVILVAAAGNRVEALHRLRFGDWECDDLLPGQWRFIQPED